MRSTYGVHANSWVSVKYSLVRAFCFGDFKPKSLMIKSVYVNSRWTPGGLLMDSGWTLHGLLMDFCWTLDGLLVDSSWTPGGLRLDSGWTPMDCRRTPLGVLQYTA